MFGITDNLGKNLEKLMEAVRDYYNMDKTTAGVVMAYLPNGNYYISVVRYPTTDPYDRKVIAKAQHTDLKICIKTVADNWLGAIGHHKSVDELKSIVTQ